MRKLRGRKYSIWKEIWRESIHGTSVRGLGFVIPNINVETFDITVICLKFPYAYFLISTDL